MNKTIIRSKEYEEKKKLKFYISRLEELPASFKNFYRNQYQTYYAILCFLEGSGVHWIDFRPHSIEPYSLFFLNPSQVHSWKFTGPVKGYMLKIYPEDIHGQDIHSSLLKNLRYFQNVNKIEKIELENTFQLKFDFEKILQEKQSTADQKKLDLLVQLILFQILIEYNKNYSMFYQTNSFHSEIINLVDQYYQKEKTNQFYLKKLKLPVDQLESLCIKYFGKNFDNLLFDRTILQIKRLLVHSDMSPMEIALHTGFDNLDTFYKFFRLYTKLTTDEFRESHNQIE